MLAKKNQNQAFEEISALNQPSKVSHLPLASIRLDGETQPRVGINWHHIRLLEAAIKEGENLEPVVVFFDGQSYWLADGFHRWYAHRNQEKPEIACYVKSGSRRDAILYSVGANAEHKAALPRSREDKRRAVLILLQDAEWGKWSDRAIARQCQVHHQIVAKLRSSLDDHPVKKEVDDFDERTYRNKHGYVAKMKTGNIGKKSSVYPSTQGNEGDILDREQPRSRRLNLEQEILISPDHPLFPGMKATIATFPNPDSAIVILETGERELIARRYLQPYIPMDCEEEITKTAVVSRALGAEEVQGSSSVPVTQKQQFQTVDLELTEREKHLGLKYDRQNDRVLPFVERNHKNPTDIDDRPGVHIAPKRIEVNISDVVTAFISNLDVISSAQIKAVGKALVIREPNKMDAMITGMMHDRDLAKKMVKAIALIYPDVILNFTEEDGAVK